MARYFQASISGWFNYIISLFSLVILLASFSLEAAIGYHLSKGTISLKDIGLFVILWSGLTGIFSIIAGLIIFQQVNNSGDQFQFLLCSAIYMTGYMLLVFNQSIYYTQGNFRFPHLLAIVFNSLMILMLAILRYFHLVMDIHTFFLIYAAAVFIQGAILWGVAFKQITHSVFQKIDWKRIQPLFSYASLVFTGNLIFFLVYRVDYWFVNHYCSEYLLGNYIQVAKLVQLFLIIPASLASVIFPAVAEGKINLADNIKQLIRILFSFFLIVLSMLLISGNGLFVLVFGKSFSEMYQAFVWLIPGILSLIVISLLGAYFGGKNQTKVNLLGALISLLFMIVLDWAFIPIWNIRGAAMASSISYTIYMVYMLYWFNKTEKFSWTDMFIIKKTDFTILQSLLRKK